jgi:hypothetical protein
MENAEKELTGKANKKPYGNENNISMDKTKLLQIKVVLSTRTEC